ncbi:putative Pentatricopeptide repeat-containing protein [Zostera marina]|uniref:Putative Pentatricopeptide repeat-containing protein n=1 Tax=Zostera marina TaxID=29655 RepID=A0A0K9P898_ZOSMR|nr:putative Pentatricopeptide repeat-containing protein [Zostera marina]
MASSLFLSFSKPFSSSSFRKTLTLIPHSHFSSSSSPDDPITDQISVDETVIVDSSPPQKRILRGERQNGPDRTADVICHMMSKRPWTTRLQNSIREYTSRFDQKLVLDVIRLARTPEHALQFFRWVEKTGFYHDNETYLQIIVLLSQSQMLNHARCLLLDDMPKRSLKADEATFIPLLEAYGRAGIPQEVVKLFRKMPDMGIQRTVKSYDAFFKAILRRGRGMMAKRVFNAMLKDGVEPTLYTYNIMIWGFCLSEMMSTAVRFLKEMKERGVQPDVVTYNTLISGWARAKKMGEAEKLVAEMNTANLTPNDVTYTTLIKGFTSAGDVDDAVRVFEEMGKNGVSPSEKTYSLLLPGLCSDVGKASEAKRILGVMSERHLRPKDETVFLKLISRLCELGSFDDALDVLHMIEKFRVEVDCSHYNVLLETFSKTDNLNKAVNLIDEMLKRGTLSSSDNISVISSSAYNPIIAHMCRKGETKKAEIFFRQLMKKGIDDSVAFNNLVRGHSSEGFPEPAVDIIAIMNRRGIPTDSDSYVMLVESLLKKGDPAEAKTVLDSMIEHGHTPNSSLFLSVMSKLFDDGRVQTASRVMKLMVEKGLASKSIDMVDKILESLFMRGHIEEAIGRVNLLMEKDYIPKFDPLLISLCEKEKTIPSALNLAEFVLDRDCDVSFTTFDRVLEALCNSGKTLNAYSLLYTIQKKGGVTDKKAASDLIKSLIDDGNTKQADVLSRLIFGDSRERRAAVTRKVSPI